MGALDDLDLGKDQYQPEKEQDDLGFKNYQRPLRPQPLHGEIQRYEDPVPQELPQQQRQAYKDIQTFENDLKTLSDGVKRYKSISETKEQALNDFYSTKFSPYFDESYAEDFNVVGGETFKSSDFSTTKFDQVDKAFDAIGRDYADIEARVAEGDTKWFGDDTAFLRAQQKLKGKKRFELIKAKHDRMRKDYDHAFRAHENSVARKKGMTDAFTSLPLGMREAANKWKEENPGKNLSADSINKLLDSTKFEDPKYSPMGLLLNQDKVDPRTNLVMHKGNREEEQHQKLQGRRLAAVKKEGKAALARDIKTFDQETKLRDRGLMYSVLGRLANHSIYLSKAEKEALHIDKLKKDGFNQYKGVDIASAQEALGGEDRVIAAKAIENFGEAFTSLQEAEVNYAKNKESKGISKAKEIRDLAQLNYDEAVKSVTQLGFSKELLKRGRSKSYFGHLRDSATRGSLLDDASEFAFALDGWQEFGTDKASELISIMEQMESLEGSHAFQKFGMAESEGLLEAFGNLFSNFEAIPELITETIVGFGSSYFDAERLGATVGVGAGTGLAIGSAGFNPLTAGGGAATGALWGARMNAGLASFVMEYVGEFLGELDKEGVDWRNPNVLVAAVNNPALMDKVREKARTKSGTVAFFDLVAAGIAGRTNRLVKKPSAMKKLPKGIKAFRQELDGAAHASWFRNLAAGGAELAVQGSLGGMGEGFGQLLTLDPGEEIDWDAIAAEIGIEMVGPGGIGLGINSISAKSRGLFGDFGMEDISGASETVINQGNTETEYGRLEQVDRAGWKHERRRFNTSEGFMQALQEVEGFDPNSASGWLISRIAGFAYGMEKRNLGLVISDRTPFRNSKTRGAYQDGVVYVNTKALKDGASTNLVLLHELGHFMQDMFFSDPASVENLYNSHHAGNDEVQTAENKLLSWAQYVLGKRVTDLSELSPSELKMAKDKFQNTPDNVIRAEWFTTQFGLALAQESGLASSDKLSKEIKVATKNFLKAIFEGQDEALGQFFPNADANVAGVEARMLMLEALGFNPRDLTHNREEQFSRSGPDAIDLDSQRSTFTVNIANIKNWSQQAKDLYARLLGFDNFKSLPNEYKNPRYGKTQEVMEKGGVTETTADVDLLDPSFQSKFDQGKATETQEGGTGLREALSPEKPESSTTRAAKDAAKVASKARVTDDELEELGMTRKAYEEQAAKNELNPGNTEYAKDLLERRGLAPPSKKEVQAEKTKKLEETAKEGKLTKGAEKVIADSEKSKDKVKPEAKPDPEAAEKVKKAKARRESASKTKIAIGKNPEELKDTPKKEESTEEGKPTPSGKFDEKFEEESLKKLDPLIEPAPKSEDQEANEKLLEEKAKAYKAKKAEEEVDAKTESEGSANDFELKARAKLEGLLSKNNADFTYEYKKASNALLKENKYPTASRIFFKMLSDIAGDETVLIDETPALQAAIKEVIGSPLIRPGKEAINKLITILESAVNEDFNHLANKELKVDGVLMPFGVHPLADVDYDRIEMGIPRLAMNFSTKNGAKRDDVKGETTMEWIKNGQRTATTRTEAQVRGVKQGDIIEFYDGKETVLVKVTHDPYRVNHETISEGMWSRYEGWHQDMYKQVINADKPRFQFRYRLLNKEETEAARKAPIKLELKEHIGQEGQYVNFRRRSQKAHQRDTSSSLYAYKIVKNRKRYNDESAFTLAAALQRLIGETQDISDYLYGVQSVAGEFIDKKDLEYDSSVIAEMAEVFESPLKDKNNPEGTTLKEKQDKIQSLNQKLTSFSIQLAKAASDWKESHDPKKPSEVAYLKRMEAALETLKKDYGGSKTEKEAKVRMAQIERSLKHIELAEQKFRRDTKKDPYEVELVPVNKEDAIENGINWLDLPVGSLLSRDKKKGLWNPFSLDNDLQTLFGGKVYKNRNGEVQSQYMTVLGAMVGKKKMKLSSGGKLAQEGSPNRESVMMTDYVSLSQENRLAALRRMFAKAKDGKQRVKLKKQIEELQKKQREADRVGSLNTKYPPKKNDNNAHMISWEDSLKIYNMIKQSFETTETPAGAAVAAAQTRLKDLMDKAFEDIDDQRGFHNTTLKSVSPLGALFKKIREQTEAIDTDLKPPAFGDDIGDYISAIISDQHESLGYEYKQKLYHDFVRRLYEGDAAQSKKSSEQLDRLKNSEPVFNMVEDDSKETELEDRNKYETTAKETVFLVDEKGRGYTRTRVIATPEQTDTIWEDEAAQTAMTTGQDPKDVGGTSEAKSWISKKVDRFAKYFPSLLKVSIEEAENTPKPRDGTKEDMWLHGLKPGNKKVGYDFVARIQEFIRTKSKSKVDLRDVTFLGTILEGKAFPELNIKAASLSRVKDMRPWQVHNLLPVVIANMVERNGLDNITSLPSKNTIGEITEGGLAGGWIFKSGILGVAVNHYGEVFKGTNRIDAGITAKDLLERSGKQFDDIVAKYQALINDPNADNVYGRKKAQSDLEKLYKMFGGPVNHSLGMFAEEIRNGEARERYQAMYFAQWITKRVAEMGGLESSFGAKVFEDAQNPDVLTESQERDASDKANDENDMTSARDLADAMSGLNEKSEAKTNVTTLADTVSDPAEKVMESEIKSGAWEDVYSVITMTNEQLVKDPRFMRLLKTGEVTPDMVRRMAELTFADSLNQLGTDAEVTAALDAIMEDNKKKYGKPTALGSDILLVSEMPALFSERFSAATRAALAGGWNKLPEEWKNQMEKMWYGIRVRIYNQHISLEELSTRLNKELKLGFGDTARDFFDVMGIILPSYAKVKIASRVFDAKYKKPILNILEEYGVSDKQFGEYVQALSAGVNNRHIRKLLSDERSKLKEDLKVAEESLKNEENKDYKSKKESDIKKLKEEIEHYDESNYNNANGEFAASGYSNAEAIVQIEKSLRDPQLKKALADKRNLMGLFQQMNASTIITAWQTGQITQEAMFKMLATKSRASSADKLVDTIFDMLALNPETGAPFNREDFKDDIEIIKKTWASKSWDQQRTEEGDAIPDGYYYAPMLGFADNEMHFKEEESLAQLTGMGSGSGSGGWNASPSKKPVGPYSQGRRGISRPDPRSALSHSFLKHDEIVMRGAKQEPGKRVREWYELFLEMKQNEKAIREQKPVEWSENFQGIIENYNMKGIFTNPSKTSVIFNQFDSIFESVQEHPDGKMPTQNRIVVEPVERGGKRFVSLRRKDVSLRTTDKGMFFVKKEGELEFVKFRQDIGGVKGARIFNELTNNQVNKLLGVDLQNNLVLRTINWGTRMLAQAYTSYNPDFILTNLVRDMTTATLNLGEDDKKRITKAYTKQFKKFPSYINKIRKAEAALDEGTRSLKFKNMSAEEAVKNIADDDIAQWFQFFEAHGMRTSFTKQEKQTEMMSALQDAIGDKKFPKVEKVKNIINNKGVRGFVDFVENANVGVENVSRVVVAKEMLKSGKFTLQQSVMAGRNISVDFNKKGTWSSGIGSLMLFFNAGVQGNIRFVKSVFSHGSGRAQKLAVSIIGASILHSMLQRMLSAEEDDEENNHYNNLGSYIRNNNLVIFTGDKKHITIPLPWGYNIFWSIGQRIAHAMAGGNIIDEGAGIVNDVHNTLNPLAGGITPGVFAPISAVIDNETFYGAPLTKPKRDFDVEKPPAFREVKGTKQAFIDISRAMNSFFGGDSVKPATLKGLFTDEIPEGDFDINLAMSGSALEHLFEGYTGGPGAFLSRILSGAASLVDDEPIDMNWNEVPVTRRFFKGDYSNFAISKRFYNLRDRVLKADTYVRNLKNGVRIDEAKQGMKNNKELLSIKASLDGAESRRKDLQRMLDKLEQSNIPPAEKKLKREKLEKQRVDAWKKVLYKAKQRGIDV